MLHALALALLTPPKLTLDMKGLFVEACSCKGTCAFETAGEVTGCHALGAYRIDRGSYGGIDISGAALAFVITPSGDLFVYIDAPTNVKRKRANLLAVALWGKDFGKWHEPQAAKIILSGRAGAYTLQIDNGQVASLSTTPVKGGDGKSFVKMNNVFGDPYDSLWQAKIRNASFNDEGQQFKLKNTSAFFADPLAVKKKL